MTTSVKERPGAEVDAAQAKGGKKKLMIILAVVVLAVAGGGYFFLSQKSSAAATPKAGLVLTLDPVAVNLAGGGYLKVGVALQLTDSVTDIKTVEGSKAVDIIISTFSGAKPADITGARDALKASLEQKIIKAYGKGVVMGIYYTNYVTQ
jgi:flagellar FliL protein